MNLTNQFLIAMPTLGDPNFSQSVTYVCAHSEDGAMGIVINKPLDLNLRQLYEHLQLEATEGALSDAPVVLGGPVETKRGFVLHEADTEQEWESVLQVADGLAVATSMDIISALADGRGPERSLVALGYAGWGAGQLESEVLDNAWLSGPSDAGVIFETPFADRWQRAAELLGVDLTRLSTDTGHA